MSAVFLFHRDLRLEDNSALNLAAGNAANKVIPLFVLDDCQIDPHKNEYFSHPSVQFMSECLTDLNSELIKRGSRLVLGRGKTLSILDELHASTKFEFLYANRDVTVFAKERDAGINLWCVKNGVKYIDCEDYDIVSSDRLLYKKDASTDAKPYTVLSHYFNRFLKEAYTDKSLVRPVQTVPVKFAHLNDKFKFEVPIAYLSSIYTPNPHALQHGGRSNGLTRIAKISDIYRRYPVDRHIPSVNGTTLLSGHLKFGTVSIREFFWEVARLAGNKFDNDLIREILFRSFYIKIWSNDPSLQRGSSIQQLIDDAIPWNTPKDAPDVWQAWVNGKTGFPMADAAMRQLKHENFVHGRPRMATATVATRYLLLDWRDCMKYFGQHLTDYDPIANAAGWAFGCSLGENAQNIWRAPMNPFLQSKNYDPDCAYIKKWLPELIPVPPRDIHNWSTATAKKYPSIKYPAPIVDQKTASNRATTLWKNAARKLNPL